MTNMLIHIRTTSPRVGIIPWRVGGAGFKIAVNTITGYQAKKNATDLLKRFRVRA
jgi:hypothetical protein